MKGILLRQVACCFFKPALLISVIASQTGCIEYDLNGSIDSPALGTTCTDNLDNDHDGWFDGEDPDCPALIVAAELGFGGAVCNDGLDNDGDSNFDSEDEDCDDAMDESEALVVVASGISISEFMANPAAMSDTSGEWFEVHNGSTAEINLNGWTIADAGGSHLIAADLLIPVDSYAVFSRGADDINGLPAGLPLAYVYGSSLYFSNSEDEIKIIDPSGTVVDAIAYSAEDIAAGKSTMINGGSWCLSTILISGGAGDYGSPGANESCP